MVTSSSPASSSSPHRRLVDGLLRTAGVAPLVALESEDHATIIGLMSAGLGVAVVPDAVARRSGVDAVAISGPGAPRTIGLSCGWTGSPPAPAERFRRFVLGPRGGLGATLSDGGGHGPR